MSPIQQIMAQEQPRTDALPVIYSGFRPRLLGYAASQRDASLLGIMSRVSCIYISTARCDFSDGQTSGEFFLLHG
jgi:hypothetical protein